MSTVWRKTTIKFSSAAIGRRDSSAPFFRPSPTFTYALCTPSLLIACGTQEKTIAAGTNCRGYKTVRRVKNTGMEYLPLSFEVTQPFREETSLADALPSDVTQTDADAPSSPSVDAIVLMNDLVTYVRSFECDGTVVAAILTQPIYLASERKKLKDDLTDKLTSALGKPAVVTFDMEVFRKIKGDLSDDDKRRLLKTALKNGVL